MIAPIVICGIYILTQCSPAGLMATHSPSKTAKYVLQWHFASLFFLLSSTKQRPISLGVIKASNFGHFNASGPPFRGSKYTLPFDSLGAWGQSDHY
jgi:hypothetical protein